MDAQISKKLQDEFSMCEYCFLPIDILTKQIERICDEMPFLQEAILGQEKNINDCLTYIQLELQFKILAHLNEINVTELPNGWSIIKESAFEDGDLQNWILNYYVIGCDEIGIRKSELSDGISTQCRLLNENFEIKGNKENGLKQDKECNNHPNIQQLSLI